MKPSKRPTYPHSAAEAYTKAGAFESSIKALKDSGQVTLASLERGKLLLQQGENLAAAQEFEKGDHHLEAADAFLKANLTGKAARSYLKAERPELAVRLFLEAGEELQALTCYEKMKDFDKAAQLAAHIGLQDRQAYFYEKGGRFIAAAHSHLMIYETEAAVRCLEQVTIDNDQVADECSLLLESLFEQHRQKEALACAYGLLEGKKAKPLLAPVLFVLAKIHERGGNLEKANQFYCQVASLVPDNTKYQSQAKRIAGKVGKVFTPGTDHSDSNSQPLIPSKEKNSLKQGRKPPSPSESARKKIPSREMPKKQKRPVPTLGPEPASFSTPESDVTLTLDEQTVYDLTESGSLSRYQVIKELGHGGMGYVYKAKDKKLKRFVALKMLHPEMNEEPRVVLFFKREAIAIASLNHPNLVSLYDLGQEKGCFYMVMEYLEGINLKKLRQKEPRCGAQEPNPHMAQRLRRSEIRSQQGNYPPGRKTIEHHDHQRPAP